MEKVKINIGYLAVGKSEETFYETFYVGYISVGDPVHIESNRFNWNVRPLRRKFYDPDIAQKYAYDVAKRCDRWIEMWSKDEHTM